MFKKNINRTKIINEKEEEINKVIIFKFFLPLSKKKFKSIIKVTKIIKYAEGTCFYRKAKPKIKGINIQNMFSSFL